jgi:two-component system, NtrC family, response regulator HydG
MDPMGLLMNGGCMSDDHSTVKIPLRTTRCGWMLEIQDAAGVRRVPLHEGRPLVVGSSSRADILADDGTVSGLHCSFTPCPSGIEVRDLRSTNGTFVGTARVEQACAGAGTIVTAGRTTIMLTEADADDIGESVPSAALPGVAGASPPMRRVAGQVRRFSRYSQPVFISGETGTGKELVARALHDEGPRAGKPFIPINVAALPRELVESELFGHERGSFTGAVVRRAGAFAEAEGGTLFLDEIGELPLDAQPKLLRALDGYEVRRVGANGGGKRANVRVIAASHVALEERVDAGRFRRDLYHRLAVYVIEVPPLRERRGDIAAIACRVLSDLRDEIGDKSVSSSALARLAAHDWPGNVRELRNVLVRSADMAGDARVIDGAEVERAIRSRSEPPKAHLTAPLAKSLLEQHQNNLSAAARAAGYPRTTFRKVLQGNTR